MNLASALGCGLDSRRLRTELFTASVEKRPLFTQARRARPVDVVAALVDASGSYRGSNVADKSYELAVASPIGWIGIRTDGPALAALDILADRPATVRGGGPVARRASEALARYFAGDPGALAGLPVAAAGTPFQRRVWDRLRVVPAGGVVSYGALARELRTSARAVGGACRANPIPLAIPCHRVVAAHGLGGYSGERGGDWLEKKRWLLAHEGVSI